MAFGLARSNRCIGTGLRILGRAGALAACGFLAAPTLAVRAADSLAAADSEWVYRVQFGDSLIALGNRFLARPAHWRGLQRLNGVQDPDFIMAGSTLRIPVAWLRIVPASATVVAAEGDVSVERPGGGVRAIPGDRLGAGDRLRCGANSFASVRLEDGSLLKIMADSDLTFGSLDRFTVTGMFASQLKIARGRLENLVAPATGPASRFEVETPAAVTAVRGTQYRVTAEADATRAEVVEGGVGVANDAGQVTVLAGFGTVARPGVAPKPPVPLLAAPDLANLPARIQRRGPPLPFAAVSGARAYRTQFAADAAFQFVVADSIADSAAVARPPLAGGAYFLRVRAIDSEALEGLSAERSITIEGYAAGPAGRRPAWGEDTFVTQPSFTWAPLEGASAYRLQIARDAAFAETVVDVPVGSAVAARSPLEIGAGRYHWRAVAEVGNESVPGAAIPFQRLPVAPQPRELAVSDGSVVLSWFGAEAPRHRIQVARDAAFEQVVRDLVLAEPRLLLSGEGPGRYYVRLQALGPADLVGPWGAAAAIDLLAPAVP